jgi:hypothetical protein
MAVTVLAGLTLAPSLALAEPLQWTDGPGANGHYYQRIARALPWADAKAAAENMEWPPGSGIFGHLVTITSADEQAFIEAFILAPPREARLPAWIGGWQDNEDPDFQEPDGGWHDIEVPYPPYAEGWVYTHWWSGQPDNRPIALEDRVEMYQTSSNGRYGFWNDQWGVFSREYIVEWGPEDAGEMSVSVDIKPGSCPNPFNPKSKGVLPVAILGTEDFDVSTIDPDTILLVREGVEGSVAPARVGFEDVGTPVDGEECECHDADGDGWLDLTLKFRTQEIVANLNGGALPEDDVVSLTVIGSLETGDLFAGSDCVRLVPANKIPDKLPNGCGNGVALPLLAVGAFYTFAPRRTRNRRR